ncbi:11499_t:CDS:1, partial [Gigaspora rosea]
KINEHNDEQNASNIIKQQTSKQSQNTNEDLNGIQEDTVNEELSNGPNVDGQKASDKQKVSDESEASDGQTASNEEQEEISNETYAILNGVYDKIYDEIL